MKNKVLNNKFKFLVLILTTILFTFTSVYVIFSKNSKTAEAASVTNYDEYTDTDEFVLSNTKYDIGKYVESLYATKGRVVGGEDSFWLSLAENDPITSIVPEELFFKINSTLIVGKEYGFYISTKIVDSHFESIVLVFDIIYKDNLPETIDKVEVKVMPLFQYKYAGLHGSSSISFDRRDDTASGSTRYSTETFSYNLSQNRVIALPISTLFCGHHMLLGSSTRVTYGMIDEYYLKDISFGASLFNEQELNKGDTDYNPYSDLGTYFTSFDYTYNGRLRKNGKFPGHNLGWSIVDTVMYGVGWFDSIPVIGIISKIYDTVSLIHGWVETGMEINASSQANDITSGELTITPFYQNRDDQLLYYRDSNGQPTLTKTIAIDINGNTDGEIWYGVGGDATFYASVNHSALNGQQPWRTQLFSEIALKVVSASNDQVIAESSGIYSRPLREKVYKELQLDTSKIVSLLPNGENSFYFTPQYTSDYIFSLNLNNSAKIKVNGVTLSETNPSVRLNAGTYNTIEVYGNENRAIGSIAVSPNSIKKMGNDYVPLENLELTANDRYIISFNSNVAVYKIIASNSSILISILSNGNITPANLVYYPSKFGGIVYILLTNTTNSAINTNLTVTLPETLAGDEPYTKPIGAEFTYYKVQAQESGYYGIALGCSDVFNYDYLLSNGSNLGTLFITGSGDCIVMNIYLEQGQAFYLGVKTFFAGNSSMNIKFAKPEIIYTWFVDGKKIEGNTIKVPRGESREIHLKVNDENFDNYIKDSTAYLGGYSYTYNMLMVNNNARLYDGHKIMLDILNNGECAAVPLYIMVTYGVQPEFETYRNSSVDFGIKWANNLSESGDDNFKISLKFTYADGSVKIVNDLTIPSTAGSINLAAYGNHNNNVKEFKVEITGLTITTNISTGLSITYIHINSDEIHNINITGELKIRPYFLSGGEGTALDPFLINTIADFNDIINAKTGFYYYKQAADITFSGSHSLHTVTFYGEYDGNNKFMYYISYNISASATNAYIGGVFGINRGVIKNLYVNNLTITSVAPANQSTATWVNAGGIAGANYGLLDNITLTYSKVDVQRMNAYVGGITGYNYIIGSYYKTYSGRKFNIYSCDIYGRNTSISSSGDTGGIAGLNYGNLYSCHAGTSYYLDLWTQVTLYQILDNNKSLGGIVGYNSNGYIVNCVNNAYVNYGSAANSSSKITPYIGKIVGTNYGGLSCIIDSACGGELGAGTLKSNQKKYFGTALSQGIGKNA